MPQKFERLPDGGSSRPDCVARGYDCANERPSVINKFGVYALSSIDIARDAQVSRRVARALEAVSTWMDIINFLVKSESLSFLRLSAQRTTLHPDRSRWRISFVGRAAAMMLLCPS